MNIFIFNEDAKLAAEDCCDFKLGIAITECAQLLSSAAIQNKIPNNDLILMPKDLANSPLLRWLKESSLNFTWLAGYGIHLNTEFVKRFGHDHPYCKVLDRLCMCAYAFPNKAQTPFPQNVPKKYRVNGNAPLAYRMYFMCECGHLAKWRNKPNPSWFKVVKQTTSY